jgi:hypothetical protein
MMRALAAGLVALCVGGLVACRPAAAPVEPTKPPPPISSPDAAPIVALDQDLPRLAERSTRLYQDIAAAFASVGVDCSAAVVQLRALQQSNAEVVTAIAKVLHDGRAREMRAALEPHQEMLGAAAKAIAESSTMTKCESDRAFTDTFDQLVGAPP